MFSPGLGCHRSLGSGSASRTAYQGILSVLCWFFFFSFVCSWVLFCVPALKPLQCLMTPALSCILSSTALLLLCHQFSSQLFICRRSNISTASLMENNSGLKMVDRSSFSQQHKTYLLPNREEDLLQWWTVYTSLQRLHVFCCVMGVGQEMPTVCRITLVLEQPGLCFVSASRLSEACNWSLMGVYLKAFDSRSLDNLLWTVNQAKGASDCSLGTLVTQRIAPHKFLHVQVRLIKIQKQSMLLFTAKYVF